VSFLVFTVALLWPAAAFMGKYTLHAYYYPREVIATGRIAVMPLVVLLGGTMLCLALAFWSFARRDIT
jgi:ABC-type transport system involved in multi-copper enzyme maturation permease subunit